jgi:hypothetical protein
MPLATFCGGSMVSSAWYKFNTGNNNAIIIDISSGDLTTPIVALVENCNTILSCESKIGNLAMNSEYYIVVADQNNLQGDFSLCLTLSRDSSLCIRDSLVVTILVWVHLRRALFGETLIYIPLPFAGRLPWLPGYSILSREMKYSFDPLSVLIGMGFRGP